MPAFTLTDQFGRRFDNASIAGHEVVLAAFHTSCRETCPLYTGLFMQLRRELPPDVLLVEATTNPWEDGPDVLREYAGRVGASWTLLTGDPAALAAFWSRSTSG
jgi:cytochrome oxidase Cu insertion factor (SCO1/SenC/PrrC family)